VAHVRFINHGESQRSFRLRPRVNGKKVPVRQGVLVVVPGKSRDGVLGSSDPVDRALVEQALTGKGPKDREEWLVTLLEEQVLTFEEI
jgi:hypothetical protein